MSQQTERFSDMERQIEKCRRAGRSPLFVLGAGVSAAKVSVMGEIFAELGIRLKQFAEDCKDDGLKKRIQNVSDDAQRLANDSLYQSRAIASKFFGILQQQEEYRNIWDGFTAAFLMGLKDKPPIWNLKYTSFHSYVAKQVVMDSVPAFCISLNYDGLTAKAIAAQAKTMSEIKESGISDPLYPCRVLTTAEEIRNYNQRNAYHFPGISHFYPLIKLRGDIFNAVCDNEECKYFGQRSPVYEIVNPTGSNEGKSPDPKAEEENASAPSHDSEDKRRAYEKIITCNGCGRQRKIELDFPGYRTKELEVEEVIEELCRYMVPSLSCVVVCGVSGKWDSTLVEFLRLCVEQRDVDMYCIDIEEQPSLKALLNLRGAKREKFIHIKLDTGKFQEGVN